MKKLINPMICALMIISIFSGCSKDDEQEGSNKKNYFAVDGMEYELSAGALVCYGLCDPEYNDCDEGNMIELVLAYDENDVTTENIRGAEFEGPGEIINFWIQSKKKTELPDGEYNYDGVTPASIFTYSDGYYVNDWSAAVKYKTIQSGKLNVKVVNGEYEITINCVDSEKKVITGYYKGILNVVDLTE